MAAADYIRAHEHSMGNCNEILSSERCGCFYCLEIFLPMEVKEWIGEKGIKSLFSGCLLRNGQGRRSRGERKKRICGGVNQGNSSI